MLQFQNWGHTVYVNPKAHVQLHIYATLHKIQICVHYLATWGQSFSFVGVWKMLESPSLNANLSTQKYVHTKFMLESSIIRLLKQTQY